MPLPCSANTTLFAGSRNSHLDHVTIPRLVSSCKAWMWRILSKAKVRGQLVSTYTANSTPLKGGTANRKLSTLHIAKGQNNVSTVAAEIIT